MALHVLDRTPEAVLVANKVLDTWGHAGRMCRPARIARNNLQAIAAEMAFYSIEIVNPADIYVRWMPLRERVLDALSSCAVRMRDAGESGEAAKVQRWRRAILKAERKPRDPVLHRLRLDLRRSIATASAKSLPEAGIPF